MSEEQTRITDGGVTVRSCPGCGQDTIYLAGWCSDCQVDMQMGELPGTGYRMERARDVVEAALCEGGNELTDIHVTHPDIAERIIEALSASGLLATSPAPEQHVDRS